MISRNDVFISYSRTDAGEYADAIRDSLVSRGFSVFLDKELLASGPIMDQLRDAIDDSELVLILLSESAVESPWIKEELALALRRNKHVVPVLLHDAARETALSSLLADRIGVEATDEPPRAVAQKVKEAISSVLGAEYRRRMLRRRFVVMQAISVLVMVIMTTFAVFSYQQARRASNDAQAISTRGAAQLRENRGAPAQDLRGRVLVDVDLSRLNLERAILSRALLVRTDLSGCQLTEADLTRSFLSSAILRNSIAERATFQSAHLVACDLTEAKLNGANFDGADLRLSDMTGADLRGASFRSADLRGAVVNNALFEEARFDETTKFPTDDFDAVSLGMVLVGNED